MRNGGKHMDGMSDGSAELNLPYCLPGSQPAGLEHVFQFRASALMPSRDPLSLVVSIEVERDPGCLGSCVAGCNVLCLRLHFEVAQQFLDDETCRGPKLIEEPDWETSPDHEDGQAGSRQDARHGLQESPLQAEQILIHLGISIATVSTKESALIDDIVIACGNVWKVGVESYAGEWVMAE